MVNLIKSAKEEITALLMGALDEAQKEGLVPHIEGIEVSLEKPKEKSHGDYSCTFCLQAAKQSKMAPRKLAEILAARMKTEGTCVSKLEIAGPGFINFSLSDDYRREGLKAIFKDPCSFGRTDHGKGKRVMVEFVSANPTGPMHMGNARGGALGDCLAGALSWAGYDVTREFYVNDAGNQIEKFYRSLKARYTQIILGEDACEFPEDGYHGEDIKARAKEFYDIHGDKYLNVSDEEQKEALVGYALTKNVEALKRDLEKYRITYDNWFFESTLYEKGEVQRTLEMLRKKGLTYISEGAEWFALTKLGLEKDEVLVRANGIPTYFAADIAYHRNKLETRGFDWAIDVWGTDHHGHVARMKRSLDAVGLSGDKLDVVLIQLVRLVRGGEVIRMSKRTGKAITLTDLLEETSVDAARFFFNMRQNSSHLDFDLDLAIEESSQNPVFYVQYAYARICSMMGVLEKDGYKPLSPDKVDFSLLREEEELDLINHLNALPEEINEVARTLDPSRLTRYIIELATLFHRFYNAHRVKVEDEALLHARLKLVEAVRIAMSNILGILKITAPEKM
ncbi:MAG: arginine--tRNA ligase [Clostridia bacterium]|nr:arginine--tRNA ligase [Clostridia bacterium]